MCVTLQNQKYNPDNAIKNDLLYDQTFYYFISFSIWPALLILNFIKQCDYCNNIGQLYRTVEL